MILKNMGGAVLMKWLKEFAIYFIIIGLIVIFVVPVLINIMFQHEALFPVFCVSWKASDSLSYFGSVVGGLGTIFLGVITLWQAEQLNKKSEEIENANTKRPFFIITKIISDQKKEHIVWEQGANGFVHTYTDSHYAFIEIVNVGDGVANNLIIEPWGIGDIPKDHRPSFCIPPQSSCTIPVHLLAKYGAKTPRYISIIYENLIGYCYSQKIELHIDFTPDIVGGTEVENGIFVPDYQEQFSAKIFNIYPQVSNGMRKYNQETGKYDLK